MYKNKRESSIKLALALIQPVIEIILLVTPAHSPIFVTPWTYSRKRSLPHHVEGSTIGKILRYAVGIHMMKPPKGEKKFPPDNMFCTYT
jgi:hypothetical protein